VREAVVDGESGLLVDPQDEVGLADALQRLLADRTLRAELGANARRRVAECLERHANLPAVSSALASAGLIPSLLGSNETAVWELTAV